ncbi:hypothetical protein [Bacteroides fluxus]|nr:hypothetical protein [Bacteroides fluxus]
MKQNIFLYCLGLFVLASQRRKYDGLLREERIVQCYRNNHHHTG